MFSLRPYTYDEEGTYTITVTITLTSTGQSVSQDQSIDVTDAAITVIGATADLPEGVDEDQVMGTFTDANPNATLADFTATVEPGSPVMSVADVMITQPDGVGTPFVVTAEVNGDDSGLGNEEQDGSGFLLTVADIGGSVGKAPGQFNWFDPVLVDPGIKVQAVAGSAFQGKIASFTTTDPRATAAAFTAVVNWGDGQSSAATIAPNSAGGFFVLGDHTYAQPGTFTVSATISDDQGHSVADTTTATVGLPLATHGIDFATVAGKRFAGAVTKFTDPDRTAAAGSLSALINWGDGTQFARCGRGRGEVEGGRDLQGRRLAHIRGARTVRGQCGHRRKRRRPDRCPDRRSRRGQPRLVRVIPLAGESQFQLAPSGRRARLEPSRGTAGEHQADRRVRESVAQRPVPLTNHGMAFPVTIDRKSGRVV